jgi:dihydrolipoamide dehydrogenase
MQSRYDIAIIGGGPGGYVAAIKAAQYGYSTVVIEKENLGGVCLNWGCIPTKALLKNAEVYDTVVNKSKDFGVTVGEVNFDFTKTIKRSRTVSKKIVKGVEYLFKKNGITRIKGFGKLNSDKTISVIDDEGNVTEKIESDKIIIATGARPKSVPTIPVDRKFVITSSEAMVLPEQPEELIIIGAGVIGIEFAYFYSTIGTKVTVVEMLSSILPMEDKEIATALQTSLEKRGVKFILSAKVEKVNVNADNVMVEVVKDAEHIKIVSDKVLNAIGVSANIDGIGLEEVGVKTEKGVIKVNKSTYQTNVKDIYAIGDVIGPPALAHAASAEGIHCIEKIHGNNIPDIDYSSVPSCIYSQPQIASIGITEDEAVEKELDVKIGKFPLSASGKASAIGVREGFIKMIFDKKYGELLGAHIIGPDATELIGELGIVKSLEGTNASIANTIHAHPTLSEIIMEAAEDADGKAIHI